MRFIQSDGGKAACGYDKVDNDCFIRSLAHIAKVPYTEAMVVAKREVAWLSLIHI